MSHDPLRPAPARKGLLARIKSSIVRQFTMETIFTTFYRKNVWFNTESRSGPGSTLAITEAIRRELPELVRQLDVRRLLDIPCGDFHWMKEVDLDLDRYIGADIVSEMVQQNNRRYADELRSFLKLDITQDPVPQVDLVFCRDCLVHLPEKRVWQALENIERSGSTYLLTTTFPRQTKNKDVMFVGQWRPLNLQVAPFNFPEPLRLIDEKNTWKADRYPDKSLGLWRVADLLP
jgi:SAM-dependent methyltransferase